MSENQKGKKHFENKLESGKWFQHCQNNSSDSGSFVGKKSNVQTLASFNKKMKQVSSLGNPFSSHDNKNTTQNFGEYFDKSLGRYKRPHCQSHQASSSSELLTWKDQKSDTSLTSTYSQSFTDVSFKNDSRKIPSNHRFQKNYKISRVTPTLSRTSTLDWKTDEPVSTSLQVIVDTQVPYLKHNPWNYSYHFKSSSLRNQPKEIS